MIDAYATLGLNLGASIEDVKKAYKKLSMIHHPDRGGDADLFKEIKKAYETICNDNGTNNIEANALTALAELFNVVIDECHTLALSRVDLKQRAVNTIDIALDQTVKQLKDVSRSNEKLNKLVGRMKTKKRANVFESTLNRRLADNKARLDSINANIDRLHLMLEILKDYTFNVEEAATLRYSASNTYGINLTTY